MPTCEGWKAVGWRGGQWGGEVRQAGSGTGGMQASLQWEERGQAGWVVGLGACGHGRMEGWTKQTMAPPGRAVEGGARSADGVRMSLPLCASRLASTGWERHAPKQAQRGMQLSSVCQRLARGQTSLVQ